MRQRQKREFVKWSRLAKHSAGYRAFLRYCELAFSVDPGPVPVNRKWVGELIRLRAATVGHYLSWAVEEDLLIRTGRGPATKYEAAEEDDDEEEEEEEE